MLLYCKINSYLELADWELKEALQSAKEDREWEKEEGTEDGLKSGQIGININFNGGKTFLNLKGIGRSPKKSDKAQESIPSKAKQKVVVHSHPPAIETKSVLAQDLFNVSMSFRMIS